MANNEEKATSVADKKKRLPVFAEHFFELQNGRSNNEMGKFLGIAGATVGYYANGDRLPNAEDLKNICEKCEVSSDWLLGLSEVRTPDADLQAICEKTGLSEKFIEWITNNRNFLSVCSHEWMKFASPTVLLDDMSKNDDATGKFNNICFSYAILKDFLSRDKNFSDALEKPYSSESENAAADYAQEIEKACDRMKNAVRSAERELGMDAQVIFGNELIQYYIQSLKDSFGDLIKSILNCDSNSIENRHESVTHISQFYKQQKEMSEKSENEF